MLTATLMTMATWMLLQNQTVLHPGTIQQQQCQQSVVTTVPQQRGCRTQLIVVLMVPEATRTHQIWGGTKRLLTD
jgi:hypothetical protein